MSFQRGCQTAIRRPHKPERGLLNLILQFFESAAQHHNFGLGKVDHHFFRRRVRFRWQGRIGRAFGK